MKSTTPLRTFDFALIWPSNCNKLKEGKEKDKEFKLDSDGYNDDNLY